jgi:hypothetical protein
MSPEPPTNFNIERDIPGIPLAGVSNDPPVPRLALLISSSIPFRVLQCPVFREVITPSEHGHLGMTCKNA